MTEKAAPGDGHLDETSGDGELSATSGEGGASDAAAANDPGSETTEQETQRQAAPRGGANLASVIALAFAFFAAAASGFLWWQYRAFYVALDEADSDAAVSVQELRANLRGLQDRIAELETRDAQVVDVVDALGDRIDALPSRFADLEQRLTAVQGVSQDARDRWLRAEAEYYLAVANAELALGGRWENAIGALGLADAKLREIGNPAFGGVRERIATELQALRGARLPDVEGLSYSLGRLAARVGELPMGATVPASFGAGDSAPAAAEPGLGRAWSSLKEALAGMVRVERQDQRGATRALTSDEQALVRRQLELELEMARLGLLRGQAEVVGVSLAAAVSLLRRDFQTDDASVESAIALLEEMMALDIAPARPDISGSLELLRSLPARAN